MLELLKQHDEAFHFPSGRELDQVKVVGGLEDT
jgi:hypothetical protein